MTGLIAVPARRVREHWLMSASLEHSTLAMTFHTLTSTRYRFRQLAVHPQVVPSRPYHYMHRGDHLLTMFGCDRNRTHYLSRVRELRLACGVEIYAYFIMSNHVHLIVQAAVVAAMSQFLRGLAALHGHRRQNFFHLSPGKSSTQLVAIDTMVQGLNCMRYIELNPVNAGLVERAEDGCSSYRARVAGHEHLGWLDEAPWYRALGSNDEERQARYRAFVGERQRHLQSVIANLHEWTANANGEPAYL